METFRIAPNGVRVNSSGFQLDEELQPLEIQYTDATFTGTQVISGNTTPMTVRAAVSGKTYVPISWHVYLDHAGGTDFSGNDDIELYIGVVCGEATNALAGSADKLTTGTLVSAAPTSAADLQVIVKTGDPTGGHATAALTVRVWYVLV